MFSWGMSSRIARMTVSPPKPESKMPMLPSFGSGCITRKPQLLANDDFIVGKVVDLSDRVDRNVIVACNLFQRVARLNAIGLCRRGRYFWKRALADCFGDRSESLF